MIKIDFPNTKQGHTCESYKDGYKVIYICPKCGYRMEDNHETGNFEVVNKGNFKVKHSGSYYEPSKLEIFKNQN